MKKKNFIIIFIIILIIYGGITIFLVNNNQDDNNSNPSTSNNNDTPNVSNIDYDYLVIENTDFWRYGNGTWHEVTNYETENEKYSVFIDNEYFGDYYLKYVNSWNLIDDNNKYVHYNGSFLAFSTGFDINVIEYDTNKIDSTDLLEIKSILNFDVLETDLTTNEKLVIDLDKNGVNDKIVNVSNLDASNQAQYFNLIYIVLNGNQNILVKNNIAETDVLVEPIYSIKYILTINNDFYDSLIFEEGYFSNSGETGNILFQYKNNQYTQVISN